MEMPGRGSLSELGHDKKSDTYNKRLGQLHQVMDANNSGAEGTDDSDVKGTDDMDTASIYRCL